VVCRQALNELPGITRQLFTLRVHADQVTQIQVKTNAQRLQITAMTLTMPARGQAVLPVDSATLGRQQRFESGQHALGALEKSI
jgi:hypothetical protein